MEIGTVNFTMKINMKLKIQYNDGINRISTFNEPFDPIDLLLEDLDIVRIAKLDDDENEIEIFTLTTDPT